MKMIEVVAAIIERDGKILLAQLTNRKGIPKRKKKNLTHRKSLLPHGRRRRAPSRRAPPQPRRPRGALAAGLIVGFGKERRRQLGGGALGFRPEEDDGPTCQRLNARARVGGCELGRLGPGREREGFGPTFGPKPKGGFKNIFLFKLFMKCNSID